MSENTPPAKTAPPSTVDKQPPVEAFFDEIVEISVGPKLPEKFHLPKALLCFYSGYFAAACNGKFSEGQTKTIHLKTENAQVFRQVAYWMYTRRLLAPESALKDVLLETLAKLWVFGDIRHIPLLQNHVIHLMHRIAGDENRIPRKALKYIYENTVPGAKLRMFAMDVIAALGSPMCISPEKESEWPRPALLDLAQRTWNDDFRRQNMAELKLWEMCKYHVHEEGVICPVSRTDFGVAAV